jgi:hypothetical protein
VNLAVKDTEFAARLDADFRKDRSASREISYEEWKHRPQIERAQEWFGRLFQRQQ